MKVACETDDGTLNIHDETETCEICKDVDATMLGEPLKADALSVEAEREFFGDKMRRWCPGEPPKNSDQEPDVLADRLHRHRKQLDNAHRKAVE